VTINHSDRQDRAFGEVNVNALRIRSADVRDGLPEDLHRGVFRGSLHRGHLPRGLDRGPTLAV